MKINTWDTCKLPPGNIADVQHSFPSSQVSGLLLAIGIDQGFAVFFCRETDSKYFMFCVPGGKIENIMYILI